MEAEAIAIALTRVEKGSAELVSSSILELENSRNPSPDRRERVTAILGSAVHHVRIGDREAYAHGN